MAINRALKIVGGRGFKRPLCPERNPMKTVLTLIGVVLLVIAAVYFLVPADQLPGFFPGHEAGSTRVHMKHGIVSGVLGLVVIAGGIFMGRR
jgi:CDP-diglyceride synthetase